MTKVLFGRLRRDVMLLGSDAVEGGQPLAEQAEQAIRLGRAEECFTVEVADYFAASTIPWANVDRGVSMEKPSSLPPLNPGVKGSQGEKEQESLDVPRDVETQSISGNLEQIAQEQLDSGVTVDAGEADRRHFHAAGREAPRGQQGAEANDKAEEKAKTASLDAKADAKK